MRATKEQEGKEAKPELVVVVTSDKKATAGGSKQTCKGKKPADKPIQVRIAASGRCSYLISSLTAFQSYPCTESGPTFLYILNI